MQIRLGSVVQVVVAAALAYLCMSCASPPRPSSPLDAIDHVVVGAADLDRGIEMIRSATGVEPAAGGQHPHTGTHNALLALGAAQYLEIVAPRPGVAVAPRLAYLEQLAEPVPVMWAVGTDDIDGVQSMLEFAGYETTGAVPGSRVRPDGVKLEWATLHVTKPEIAGAPFFIEWRGSAPHPAASSPGGCRLESFEVVVPNPSHLRRLLHAAGLKIKVVQGSPAALDVVLLSPRGEVRLGPR